jgi:AraC-like DNA-binding protein
MPDQLPDRADGEVRIHHITPELWVLEARRCARRWVVFHETYSFCLVERIGDDAQVPWKYNHRLYLADSNHAMVMQPGELHANLTCTPPGDFLVVQVADSLVKRVAAELGWSPAQLNIRHPHPGSDHPLVLAALRRFRASVCTQLFDPRPRLAACICRASADRHLENLAELVAVLIEHCAEGARDPVWPRSGAAQIARAVSYLRANYNEPYSLDRVARAAGCDRFYLARVFTREMGIRPSDFQNRVLVARACQVLVMSPDKPLEIVAREVGWPGRPGSTDDAEKATLMIRHFRRTLGITPGEWRAGLREPARRRRGRPG